MKPRAKLAGIAKSIATDMRKSQLSRATQDAICALGDASCHVLDIVDLMAEEGGRKRPNEHLLGAYALLLGHGLEQLRFAIERKDAFAIELAGLLRDQLLIRSTAGEIGLPVLLPMLNQLAAAKLDIGDDLRGLVQHLVDAEDATGDEEMLGIEALRQLAAEMEHHPFAIHALLDESAETLPEAMRLNLASAAFNHDEAAVRTAALGFLLNGAAAVRMGLARHLALAAAQGALSPIELRRMISMRNWLPAGEHGHLDAAIRACRKKEIECEPWPKPEACRILASGIDGAGAQTILCEIKVGRKMVLAGLLLKHGFGVRDAWVRRNLTKRKLTDLLRHVDDEVGLEVSSMDYAAGAIRHFLGVNLAAGIMPPFGLLDAAETIGLSDLNPRQLEATELIDRLIADVAPARLEPAAVASTLKASRTWPRKLPVLDTWLEADLGKFLGNGRAPPAQQMAALLAGPLNNRRRHWAELAAWSALAMRSVSDDRDWAGMAIVARELQGERPLEDIGLMHAVAEATVEIAQLERRFGSRRAA